MGNNIEVEGRFRIRDIEEFKRKLVENGATLLKSAEIEDRYYTMKSRDFDNTIEALRIRTVTGEEGATLTYKGGGNKDSVVMAVPEYETHIDKPEVMESIFGFIDIVPLGSVKSIRKRRHSYQFGKLKVDLDEFPGFGTFADIEAIANSESETQTAIDEVNAAKERLGIPEEDRITRSIGFLMKEARENGTFKG